jgi:hypothetical protein
MKEFILGALSSEYPPAYNEIQESLNRETARFPKRLRVEDVVPYLGLADSDVRFDWFQELVEEKRFASNKAFKEAFTYAYTSGIVSDWRFFFNRCYYNWALFGSPCLDTLGRKEFKNLPDDKKITVYRGTCIDELESENGWWGPSWSTDRGVAEFFAFRHGGKDRVVVKTEVSKRDIRGFFGDRNEHEVLYVVFDKPEVVTDVPTDEFDRYFLEIHADQADYVKSIRADYNIEA